MPFEETDKPLLPPGFEPEPSQPGLPPRHTALPTPPTPTTSSTSSTSSYEDRTNATASMQRPLTEPAASSSVVGAPPTSVMASPVGSNGRLGPGRTLLVAVGVIGLLLAGFVIGLAVGDSSSSSTATPSSPSPAAVDTERPSEAVVAEDDPEPVAAVATAVAPSVVQVETSAGLGAGVIYGEGGLILTNAHVVGSADEVLVILADGRRFTGEVLGADGARDVAVVQIDAGDAELPVAVLARDDEVRVGQLAVAVGSPFGLDQTVTSGIISAVGRPLEGPNRSLLVGMIQTDAPINSGNSGGALADRHGRIIGINTSITSRSGDNTGIGFAIPISLAARVGDSIVDGTVPGPSFLGVGGPERDAGNGLAAGESGALVDNVTPGSSADGLLLEGDVIVFIDGHPVRDFFALAAFIGSYLPGDEVTLTVLRDGQPEDVNVELGERTDELAG